MSSSSSRLHPDPGIGSRRGYISFVEMASDCPIWRFADGRVWDLAGRTRIVGILNVTPDSFSDGGLWLDPERAAARGIAMVEEGADAIDVGGESTRPGAKPVSAAEERRRIEPVIAALRRRLPAERARISIDTSKTEVAAAALEAGADAVNDVSGLRGDPGMAALAARTGAALVLMHMRGLPETMQRDPRYDDLLGEVAAGLRESCAIARDAGVADDRIVLDPGIGFGKTAEHNLEILDRLPLLAGLGRPILVGVSRKSFLGLVTGSPVGERLEASLAAGAVAILRGASLLRVHDVGASVKMARTVDAIRSAGRSAEERTKKAR